jgi:hypothetical protein
MSYTTSTTATEALVRQIEARMDQVTAPGTTVTVHAQKLYGYAEEAARHIIRTANRPLLLALGTDAATLFTTEWIEQAGVKLGLRIRCVFASAGAAGDLGRIAKVLRVLRVQLDGWSRPIDALTDDLKAYEREYDAMARPPAWRPRAYLAPANGALAVEAFPAPPLAANPRVLRLEVLHELAPELFVERAPELADALYWDAAGRALDGERLADVGKVAAARSAAILASARVGFATEG